jgi:hypothetical protein
VIKCEETLMFIFTKPKELIFYYANEKGLSLKLDLYTTTLTLVDCKFLKIIEWSKDKPFPYVNF